MISQWHVAKVAQIQKINEIQEEINASKDPSRACLQQELMGVYKECQHQHVKVYSAALPLLFTNASHLSCLCCD